LTCLVCAVALGCASHHQKKETDRRLLAMALRPDILSRQAWDDKLPSGSFVNQVPQRIVIADEGEIARRIIDPVKYLRYVRRQGPLTGLYNDVPFNFYIDKSGRIYQGRMIQSEPQYSGTGSPSSGDVYVSFLDDFSINQPNDKEMGAIIRLSAWLVASYDLDPATAITTHRNLGRGPSPGAFFEAWFQEGNLVKAVKELVPEKPVEPEF